MSKKNRKSSSTSHIKTAWQLLQKYIAVTFGCFLYAFVIVNQSAEIYGERFSEYKDVLI